MHHTIDLGPGGWVTDGGLETDLLFNRGADLPEFAAFPLLEHADGRRLIEDYLGEYAAIAAAAGVGLFLETPTWRANPDWGMTLGYDAARLDALNRRAVELVRGVGERSGVEAFLVTGIIGPRGDGYVAGDATSDEAADYHLAQARSFATAGVDLVHAMTMSTVAEAQGVVRAARAAGLPVAISFTVETDGRLPDGTTLREAIEEVDATGAPDWFGVNCAHPTHVVPALEEGDDQDGWRHRIRGFRPNASTMTHEELDAMTELDVGDIGALARGTDELRRRLPAVQILGGCCGTDSRHVAALWGVTATAAG